MNKKFILIFIACLVAIQFLLTLDIVQSFSNLISGLLVSISSFIINLFDNGVMRNGLILSHSDSGIAISVDSACSALELTLFLFAAIIAFPASIKNKLMGLSFGLLGVQLLNIVRIISLFYIIDIYPEWFDWAHEYFWRFLIILDVYLCFSIWVYYDYIQRSKALVSA